MVESFEGKTSAGVILSCYESFGNGNCEFCLDAYECEKDTFKLKNREEKG